MATQRHLRNAPIREAVIDIRTSPSTRHSIIEQLGARLKGTFPTQEKIWSRTFGFEFGSHELKTSHIDKGPTGLRLSDQSGKYVAQLKLDGFTFSRLHPYETWESMKATAMPVWDEYRAAIGEAKVQRVAVRYINQMPLPTPIQDFEEFLTAPPRIPSGIPQAVSGFFCRVIVPDKEIPAVAIITQALEGAEQDKAQVILDIDISRELNLSAKDIFVSLALDQLRHFKNRVFFESITERTAELFA